MLPSVRNRLRSIESELMDIMATCDLLNYERDKLNSACKDIICADIHLAHLRLSHSRAREFGFL